MTALPDYEGHLSKNAAGQYVGVLACGRDVPIRLEAEIVACPAGKYFRLRGTKAKKSDPIDALPWLESRDDGFPAGAVDLTKLNIQEDPEEPRHA